MACDALHGGSGDDALSGAEALVDSYAQLYAATGALIGTVRTDYGHPLNPKTFEHHFTWSKEAEARLANLPSYCRELSRWRVEWTAAKKGLGPVITPEAMDVKFEMWDEVSQALKARGRSMPWDPDAAQRLENMPDFVKGQVIQAIEGNARELGHERVTANVMDTVIHKWIETGDFHEGRYGFRA